MKTVILLALTVASACAQIKPVAKASASAAVPLAPKQVVARQALADLEKDFDARLSSTVGGQPMNVLGLTRGLYLNGYGPVFTAEVDLTYTTPISPFHLQISTAEADAVYQRKLNHLPILKQAMRDMVKASAEALDKIPDSDRVVVAVRLLYRSWEKTAGLPGLIVMQASRKEALDGHVKEETQ